MERQYYLGLAEAGVKMPIGTHLVLHEQADPERILRDGTRLGQLMAQTANRYRTPLAFPVMDLELEQAHLLGLLGLGGDQPATFRFRGAPGDEAMQMLQDRLDQPLSEPMQALCDALSWLRDHTTLVPVGMCIGPFSLMTKLVSDPITPIALAGMGLSAAEDEGIAAVTDTLDLAVAVITRYVEAQAAAGARAIVLCEPAANVVYLSPKQIEQGSGIFDTFVMEPLLRVKHALMGADADLILHDCGELTDGMVASLASLDPAVLSLGSSRVLWEDARLVPNTTVLFGNLPSKRFFSDAEITVEQVESMGAELLARMRQVGHPFMLGSECDVLSVPGCEHTLHEKAMAIVRCAAGWSGGEALEALAAAGS